MLYRPRDYYEKMGVTPLLGCTATKIDPAKQIVRLADGAVVYDEAADARVLDRFGVSAPHPQLRHHCPADLA